MRTALAVLVAMLTMGLLLAGTALPAIATTYIVDAASGGDYQTIQEAVDVVVDGDIVQVVAGTYTGPGNRDINYWGANFVLESESGAAVTIIDNQGESGHRLFNIAGAEFDTTCVIRGFTIQGGHLEGNENGAGIYLGDGASPKFIDCVIRDNHSAGANGGGAYLYENCEPIFRNCTFDANTAMYYGGALVCSAQSPAVISSCTFTNNQSTVQSGLAHGGAVAMSASSDALVRNCWFEGNTSGIHGGAVGVYNSTPHFFNTVFLNNTAGGNGGAVYGQLSNAEYHNCTFVKNGAGGDGSVYYIWQASNSYFAECIFAFSQESRGSTFYCGDAGAPIVNQCCSFANPAGNEPCGTVMTTLYDDPLFCDITTDDITLASDSPCLQAENPWGVDLGALGEGCVNSPVESRSWGMIKAMYR